MSEEGAVLTQIPLLKGVAILKAESLHAMRRSLNLELMKRRTSSLMQGTRS